MTRLEIDTLGRFVVRRDGTPIALGSQRTEALFAYLVMTGRPQSRDHLVDLLWEDHRNHTAPGNLRVLFTNLRKAVGDFMAITRTSAGFAAPPDATWTLDVHVFEQRSEGQLGQRPDLVTAEGRRDLAAALAVCQGDFLEHLDLTSETRFDEWVRRQRHRLGQRRRAVLAQVCRAELATGNVPDALRHAEALVALEPLSEPAHQLVIRALVQAGDMDGAAQRFEVLEHTLRTELGTAPTPATRALFVGRPDSGGVRNGVARLRPPVQDAKRAPWTTLAGRSQEVKRVMRLAGDVQRGRGGVVAIRGVPGSGKSVLARGVVKAILEQAPDWVAVGGSSTGILPGADGDLVVDTVAGQLAGDVEGSWLGGPMPPLVADRIWGHAEERQLGPPAGERRLESVVAGRLRALAAAHPVVLVLENVQWASPATIGMLLELASDVQRRRLLIVVTMRPWHRPQQHLDLADLLLPRLRRMGSLSVLDLALPGRAGPDFVRAIAAGERHHLPDDLLVEIQRLSGGHPAMVVELLRDLVRRGVVRRGPDGLRLAGLPDWPTIPERIGALVDDWVSGLSSEAQTLLGEAAALDVVDADGLVARTGRSAAEVHSVLDLELCRRFGLLAPLSGGRFRFRQPLVRDHVRGRAGIPSPRSGDSTATRRSRQVAPTS